MAAADRSMIPYVELSETRLGRTVVPVFPILVVLALVSGYVRGMRRARALGLKMRPAWCGAHPAGLWPEQDLQSVTGATAFRRWSSLATSISI